MRPGDFVELSTVIRNWWAFPAVGFNSILVQGGVEGSRKSKEVEGFQKWFIDVYIYIIYNGDIQWWFICPDSWKLWIDTQVNWNKTKDISFFCKLWRCLQNVNPQLCQGYTTVTVNNIFSICPEVISQGVVSICVLRKSPRKNGQRSSQKMGGWDLL